MGPWDEGRECVGACVAWCDFADVYAACICVCISIDMGIQMHTRIYHKYMKQRKTFEYVFL